LLTKVKESIDGTCHNDLGKYQTIRDELYVTYDGLVFRGDRICVPASLQTQIVKIAHQGHQGVVRTRQLIRNHVWFPGIDQDVERAVNECLECQANTKKANQLHYVRNA
jgi:hypothetical protein